MECSKRSQVEVLLIAQLIWRYTLGLQASLHAVTLLFFQRLAVCQASLRSACKIVSCRGREGGDVNAKPPPPPLKRDEQYTRTEMPKLGCISKVLQTK